MSLSPQQVQLWTSGVLQKLVSRNGGNWGSFSLSFPEGGPPPKQLSQLQKCAKEPTDAGVHSQTAQCTVTQSKAQENGWVGGMWREWVEWIEGRAHCRAVFKQYSRLSNTQVLPETQGLRKIQLKREFPLSHPNDFFFQTVSSFLCDQDNCETRPRNIMTLLRTLWIILNTILGPCRMTPNQM